MSEKSDLVASALRTAILCDQYIDGERLSQSKIALEHGVHRSVVSRALYLLEFEGFVSQDVEGRYHANATYVTRQLQMVMNMLDHITWQCGVSVNKIYGPQYTMLPGRRAMLAKIRARQGGGWAAASREENISRTVRDKKAGGA